MGTQVEEVTMTNPILNNEQNVDKIGGSEAIKHEINSTNRFDEDDDMKKDPGKVIKTDNTEKIIQGIHFHTILETYLKNSTWMPLIIIFIMILQRH
eukprot:TRINITY_DN9079_c0_g1_i2.p1 TRINITY_DN9079_c0_g1~~TRINITY_DN9079_c0_g1_i2.p1  ORF type:complete len:106 (-),score=31.03 TRINITY_DN9079_c0_g1_i2:138-425(-)